MDIQKIVKSLQIKLETNYVMKEKDKDAWDWGTRKGVLISMRDAELIIKTLSQNKDTEIQDKIVQVSGFGCRNTPYTQTEYMLVGLTEAGRVVLSNGNGEWADVTTKTKAKEK